MLILRMPLFVQLFTTTDILSEENNTNKITNENFPFLFITGGSRTDNVVCTNPNVHVMPNHHILLKIFQLLKTELC